MLHVPRECQVVSTWRWTDFVSESLDIVRNKGWIRKGLTPFLDMGDVLLAVFELVAGLEPVGAEGCWG